jgi:hypothetical protein
MYQYLHKTFAANKALHTDNTYPALLARNLQLPPSIAGTLRKNVILL